MKNGSSDDQCVFSSNFVHVTYDKQQIYAVYQYISFNYNS